MAEAPPTRGGSFLTKKWHGIPVPVLAVGGGVVLILGYRWWKGRQSGGTTTPTGNTGAATGLGYPMGPSGVIGGGMPSTGDGGIVPPSSTATSGAPPADVTQPPTPPQSATTSTLGLALPGFPSTQPVLARDVGNIPGNLLISTGGAPGASYTLAPAGTVPYTPGTATQSPSLGKIISASQAIPGERYQAVPGQPGMLQVIE